MKPTLNRPILPCEHCDGSGFIQLPDKAWEVLQIVVKLKSATAEDVHKLRLKPGDGRTHVNNLLEDLRHLDLITRGRKRVNRRWVYSVI